MNSTTTNSIFHFTRRYDTLKKILKGGLKVSYCLERFIVGGSEYEVGVPMVSFCDIPLSRIGQHFKRYGKYGIGIKKEYARSHGVNPVMYMQPSSMTSRHIEQAFNYAVENDEYNDIRSRYEVRRLENGKMEVKDTFTGGRKVRIETFIGLISCLKNYQGHIYNFDGTTIKTQNYNFYSEREWRYIPDESKFTETNILYDPVLDGNQYRSWRGSSKVKPHISDIDLMITANDIEYIIVKKESQISGLVDYLRKRSELYNTKDEFQILLSKIISSEKLSNDF